MAEVQHAELKRAVESQHGGVAHYIQSVQVLETHGGQTVWDGAVAIFGLRGSPSGATRAYVWSYELPDGKRRFFAVLHIPPITSPVDAVRAAIIAESRSGLRKK